MKGGKNGRGVMKDMMKEEEKNKVNRKKKMKGKK